MRKTFFLLAFLCLALAGISTAQQQKTTGNKLHPIAGEKPKLIVGLVIDQMRWDYLYRFGDLYTRDGIKRLLSQGYSCENTLIPFIPTYTAVGHASIYTGSVPAIDGMIGNFWFDRASNSTVYCTDDSTVSGVGTSTAAGKMSPKNLWVSTITDELRLSNNFKSKVIGIALKDRGAILPAGHSANAAYWYDAGKWITSTHYLPSLPGWVDAFNKEDEAGKFMSKDWNTLLPMEKYDLSTADDKPYEVPILGEKTVNFPHRLSQAGANKYEAFKYTPFAATYTFDFAKQAIENENLGKNKATDFLTLSISSTDYTGHSFGGNSVEIEDTYLRLDRDIAEFLHYLDAKIGKDNYLLFLTADHGVAHTPGFLAEHNIPGGSFTALGLATELNMRIDEVFGTKKAVSSLQNYQVYLDITGLEKQGKDIPGIKRLIIKILKEKEFVANAFETKLISAETLPALLKEIVSNGYNDKRSGDIQFLPKPGYFDGGTRGTTHGLWNPYDAHIPLVFMGHGIKHGKTNREIYMTDIAPTLAALLQIQMPSGCVGKVISEIIN